MFQCFFPDQYLDSAYEIDFEGLYAKGYRGLIFDIDNTLVPHGKPQDFKRPETRRCKFKGGKDVP